jgi:hypothetical protein
MELVNAIAGGSLRCLHKQRLHPTLETETEFARILRELFEQETGFDFESRPGDLNQAVERGMVGPDNRGRADEAISSNNADFNRRSLGRYHDHGAYPIFKEINAFHGLTGIVQRVTLLQLDGDEARSKPLYDMRGQRGQKAVAISN